MAAAYIAGDSNYQQRKPKQPRHHEKLIMPSIDVNAPSIALGPVVTDSSRL